MKHTSKPLREWLHLLLCGLKERFPDQFSSLRSELVQEMVRDEGSGQMIPVWSVQLFVSHLEMEYEVQMERGVLSISVSGKKLFVSTGADKMSLIFSEEQLKSDSGKKPIPESVKCCSRLFELLKECFDFLKGKNIPNPQIEQFIDALGCKSEVGSYIEETKRKLTQMVRGELMKAVFPTKYNKSDHWSGEVFGFLIENLIRFDVHFSQFQEFCVKNHYLVGDYPSFVILLNIEIFNEYKLQIEKLSPELSLEDHIQKRREIYDDAMGNIERLCLELVQQWTLFHNSELFWRRIPTGFIHVPSQTFHGFDEISSDDCLPIYLGTSVLREVPSESLPSKGKKQKGKPEGNPAPEEKPQGTPVHVFMDGKSGEVFTVPISE